jgi:hypothetical protein
MPFKPTLLALSLFVSNAAFSEQSDLNQVVDLNYGVALFEMYQGDYQAALSAFAIAEYKGAIKHQGVSPQLVKAGVMLSYGLKQNAAEVFNQLIDNQQQDIAAKAWFYVAKQAFVETDMMTAQNALSKVEALLLTPEENQEFIYLKGRLALMQNNEAEFLASFNSLSEEQPFYAFLAHNYLLYQIENGQLPNSIAPLPIEATEEQTALWDRSHLALGFAHLAHGNAELAKSLFLQFGAESPWLGSALVGYGASLTALGEHQQAERVFSNLIAKGQYDIATQQAYLGKGHSLVEQQKLEQAVGYLAQSIAQFNDFENQLQNQLNSINDLAWVKQNLLSEKPFVTINHVVTDVIVDQGFVQQINQYQELHSLLEQFAKQQSQLNSFKSLAQEKQARQQRQLASIDLTQLEEQINLLSQGEQVLADYLKTAFAARSGLGDEQMLALENRVAQASEKLALLQQAGKSTAQQEMRLQRLKGVLIWLQDYEFDQNFAVIQAEHKQLKQQLDALKTQYQSLQTSSQQVHNNQSDLARVEKVSALIAENNRNTHYLLSELETRFQAQLDGALKEQQNVLLQHKLQLQLMQVAVQEQLMRESEQEAL